MSSVMPLDLLLAALLRLTLLASAGLLLMAVLRPLLRRGAGARATYAAWLLVPLMLASPWLPGLTLPVPSPVASATRGRMIELNKRVFSARGAMRHPLDEAIPGAAALTEPADQALALQRLQMAFQRFAEHQGALQPHFSYGALEHGEYAEAHVLHLYNHLSLIRIA